jgi:hypothetical protein
LEEKTLDRFILVPYEIQGKDGKIVIKEDANLKEIKMGCIKDYVEKNIDEIDVLIKVE